MMNPSTKKHRFLLPQRSSSSSPVDWTSLNQDPMELIGWLVLLSGDLHDYVRFRAVCRHWRTSTTNPNGNGILDPRFHPRRWMMLPEGYGLYPGHPDLRGFVRFLNLSTGAVVRVRLGPLMEDHAALDSVDGLLLLHRDRDTAVRLVNPFTGDVAQLPPLSSLLPQMDPRFGRFSEQYRRSYLTRVGASSVAVIGGSGGSTRTVTVMLALHLLHRVAYAAVGDRQWTLSAWMLKPLHRPVSFQGKLYALHYLLYQGTSTRKLQIYRIDPPRLPTDALPAPEKIAECPPNKIHHVLNLAECGSDILLIGYKDTSCFDLVIYRLSDLVSGKVVPVTSIGDKALFLDERCLYVSTKGLPSVSRNSIVCTRSYPHSPQLVRFEQYSLDTGTWSPASDGGIFQRQPPSPHTIIHHIFTCCNRDYWNKGVRFCTATDLIRDLGLD